jgi:hypothetical protein
VLLVVSSRCSLSRSGNISMKPPTSKWRHHSISWSSLISCLQLSASTQHNSLIPSSSTRCSNTQFDELYYSTRELLPIMSSRTSHSENPTRSSLCEDLSFGSERAIFHVSSSEAPTYNTVPYVWATAKYLSLWRPVL